MHNLFYVTGLAGVAVASGVLAGLVVTSIMFMPGGTVDLITKAEGYEADRRRRALLGMDHGKEGHMDMEGGDKMWYPKDGLERNAYTTLCNMFIGVSYAFALAAMVLARPPACASRQEHGGDEGGNGKAMVAMLGAQGGAAMGMVCFFIFNMLPAIGLPPELPAMRASDVEARQRWWWSVVIAGSIGCAVAAAPLPGALNALWERYAARRTAARFVLCGVGAMIALAPHWAGAPHPHIDSAGSVPAELEGQFAMRMMLTMAAFWVTLGGSFGAAHQRVAEFMQLSEVEADEDGKIDASALPHGGVGDVSIVLSSLPESEL